MKKYYTLEEAKRMDKLIFDLAFYEVTNGLLPVVLNYDNMMNLNEKATRKFNEFKKLLRMNEYTLEELERDVVNRNSPMPPKKNDLKGDLGAKIDEFEREEEEREKQKAEVEKNPLVGGLFGALFPELNKSPYSELNKGSRLGGFGGPPPFLFDKSAAEKFVDLELGLDDKDDEDEDYDDEDDDDDDDADDDDDDDDDDGTANFRWK